MNVSIVQDTILIDTRFINLKFQKFDNCVLFSTNQSFLLSSMSIFKQQFYFSNPSDVSTAARVASNLIQNRNIAIITIAIGPRINVTDLQPISSGNGFAFESDLDQLSTLTPSIISAICSIRMFLLNHVNNTINIIELQHRR